MLKHNLSVRLLALLLTLCMLVTLLPAVSVFAAAEEPADAQTVFSQIEALCSSIRKRGKTPTQADYAALSDDVYALVEDSGTACDDSLAANGDFISWVDRETGMPCCYSPTHEAEKAGAVTAAESAPSVISTEELTQHSAMRGGNPSSLNIGLIQPYWESNTHYEEYTFCYYSPNYLRQANSLANATGGQIIRYTMENATADAIAFALQNCGLVIFDSHGCTDYESGSDYTSQANSSYIWLTSGGIDDVTALLDPVDYSTSHIGAYGTYADVYYSGGDYCINGTVIANHMTADAPHNMLYMGICLGMATDGICAPLRAKGVEVVYGYSQSVSFDAEEEYMCSITDSLMNDKNVAEAVAAAKQEIGIRDPYTSGKPAYPIVASSEDSYPGHGNVDKAQTVNSTWRLLTPHTVTVNITNPECGSAAVDAYHITVSPISGYYPAQVSVTEGNGTCTVSGNDINVLCTTDITLTVTFAPKPEVQLSFSGIDCASVYGTADDVVTLPNPTSTFDGYDFIGWTTALTEQTEEEPDYLRPGSRYILPYADVTLYALFRHVDHNGTPSVDRYVRVTNEKMLKSAGSYLITINPYYTSRAYIFNGGLTDPKANGNYKECSFMDSTAMAIISNGATDACAVQIAPIEGTDTYSMRLQNGAGKYFGNLGSSSTFSMRDKDPYPTNIEIVDEGYIDPFVRIFGPEVKDTFYFCYYGHSTSSTTYDKFCFQSEKNYFNADYRYSVALFKKVAGVDGTLYYTGTAIACTHENAVETTTAPTCTDAGCTVYLCPICGYKWTEEGEPATGHSYTETVTAPTANEYGYTTHTCTICGDTYQDNFTDPLGNEYQVSYSVLGHILSTEPVNSFTGKTLPTSVAINPKGYTFVGWSESEISQENTTAKPLTGTYKPTKDTTLYAVYRRSEWVEGNGDYVKVTAQPESWNGDYLIVYEGGNIAFNGGLGNTIAKLNVAGNYLPVEIINSRIPASTELDAAVITFAEVSGTTNYSLKTKTGGYIGSSGSSAGMNGGKTVYPNSVTMNSDKTVTISNASGTNTYKFQYNSSTKDRFEFNTLTLKTGSSICLYLKDSGKDVYYFTTAPSVENCTHAQTVTTVTEPSCTEQGYTTYICKNCGESWTGDETAAIGHDCTYTDNGDTHTASCTRCDYSTEEEHSFTNGTCACGHQKLQFVSASLVLNGKLDLIYTAVVPEDYDDPYIVFEGPNGTETVEGEYENRQYQFTYTGINPQCIGDTVSATLYVTKDGVQESIAINGYSVRQYCVNKLADKTISAELRTLLSDLLAYGAAAQVYTEYALDRPVDEGDDIVDPTYSSFTELTGSTAALLGTADEGVYWQSAKLTLSNSVAMTFRFYAVSTENLTVKISVGEAEPRTATYRAVSGKENCYEVTVTDLSAEQFGEAVRASFFRDETQVGNTVQYCVNDYVFAKQNDSDEALASLVRALYNFGASAAAYH